MRRLVLGGSGMLGHRVVQCFASNPGDLWWTLRGGVDDVNLDPMPLLRGAGALPYMDALRPERFEAVIRDLRPDVVVNCLGVIKHRDEGSNETLCRAINAELPHRLARVAADCGGTVVHISTDCVFSGLHGPYSEDDVPDAADVYGRSKADGEVRADNVLVLRTSFIGRELRHHRSLLDWFLAQRGSVRGFRRALWTGVTTLQLASLVDRLVREHPRLHGIFHVAGEEISKYDLLLRLRDAYDLDLDVLPDDSVVRDLRLNGTKLERITGYRMPSLASQLVHLVSDPTPYPSVGYAQVLR